MDTNSIRLSSTSSVEFLKSIHSISENLRGFLLKQDQNSIHQHRTKRRKTDDQQPNPSSKTVTLTPNNNQQTSPIHPVTSLTNGYTFKLGTRNSRNSSRTSFNLERPATGSASTSTDRPRIHKDKQATNTSPSSSSLLQDSDEQDDDDSDVQSESESESDADSEYQSSSPPKPKSKLRSRKPSTTNASDEPTTRLDIRKQRLKDLIEGLEEIKGELEAVWSEMLDSCKEVRDSRAANSNKKRRKQGQLDDHVDVVHDESETFKFRLPTLLELSCRNLSIHLDLHCQPSSSSTTDLETSHYFKQMESIYETLPELGISNLLIVHAFDFMVRQLDRIFHDLKVRESNEIRTIGKREEGEEIEGKSRGFGDGLLNEIANFIRESSRLVFRKVVEWGWEFEAAHIQERLITTERTKLIKTSQFRTRPIKIDEYQHSYVEGKFEFIDGMASIDYLDKADFNTFAFASNRMQSYLNFKGFQFILEGLKSNFDFGSPNPNPASASIDSLNEEFVQVKLLSCLIDDKIFWFKSHVGQCEGMNSMSKKSYGEIVRYICSSYPDRSSMIKDHEPEKMILSFLETVFSWISKGSLNKARDSEGIDLIQRKKVEFLKVQSMKWMGELFEIGLAKSEIEFKIGKVEEEHRINDRKVLQDSSKIARSILVNTSITLASLLDQCSDLLTKDSKAILSEIGFCFSLYSLHSLEMNRLSKFLQNSDYSLKINKLLEDGSFPNELKIGHFEEGRNDSQPLQELASLISRFKNDSEAFSQTQSSNGINIERKIPMEKEESVEEIESDSSSTDSLDSETIPSSPSSTSSSSSEPVIHQEEPKTQVIQPVTFITTIQKLLSILDESTIFQMDDDESREEKILSISSTNSLSLFLLSLVLKNLSQAQETTRSNIKIASNLSILESEALKLSLEIEERQVDMDPFLTSSWDLCERDKKLNQLGETKRRRQRRTEWEGDFDEALDEIKAKSRFRREKLELWLKRSEGRSIELRSKAHKKEVEFDGKRDKKSVRLDQSTELKRDDDEEGEKWRYEELIDAWVLKTPNDVVENSNVKKQKGRRGQSTKNRVSNPQQARMANREEEDLDYITPKRPTRSSSRNKRVNQKDNVSDERGSSGSIKESDEEEIESDHSGPVLDDESMSSSSPNQVDHSSPAPSRPSKPAFQIISNEEELSLSQNEVGNDEEQDQEADVDDDDDDELNLFNQDTPAPARVRKPPTRFGNLTFSGKGWNKSGSELILDEASSALTSNRNGSPFTFDASTQSGKRSTSSMSKRSRSSLPSFGSNDLDFFNPSLKSRASSSSLRSESQKGNARESISMLLERQGRVKVMERMRRDEDAKLEQAERGFRDRKKSRRN